MRRLLLPTLVCALGLSAIRVPAADSAENGAGVGRKLYTSKCAKCHKFYDPAKYSDAKWESWMKKMGKKAKLTPEQQQELKKYIQDSFRTAKVEAAQTARR